MKTLLLSTLVGLGFVLIACNSENKSNEHPDKAICEIKNPGDMKNLISIVEVPITDFSRATAFYRSVLDVAIEEVEMDGIQMGVLAGNPEHVNVVLVKGSGYTPSPEGAVVYFNAGKDLQPTLDKVEKNGGKVIVPKTLISEEMGFFALFTDTEGNKLGLHSTH